MKLQTGCQLGVLRYFSYALRIHKWQTTEPSMHGGSRMYSFELFDMYGDRTADVRHTLGSSDQVSPLVTCTAKRLRNLAEGCRVARLPWDECVKRLQPQRGCAASVQLERISQAISLDRFLCGPKLT